MLVFHDRYAEFVVTVDCPSEIDKAGLLFVAEAVVGAVAGAVGVLAVEVVGVLNTVPSAPITAPLGVVQV
jgi:hypothetical protein